MTATSSAWRNRTVAYCGIAACIDDGPPDRFEIISNSPGQPGLLITGAPCFCPMDLDLVRLLVQFVRPGQLRFRVDAGLKSLVFGVLPFCRVQRGNKDGRQTAL